MNPFSRRRLFQGAAALTLAPTLARALPATKPAAVVFVNLAGGYNALFGSADSFIGAETFGVTGTNVRNLGNGLIVDNATYGERLPPIALSRMATLGVNHHLSSHITAQLAHWSGTNERSYPLMLAKAMGGVAGATMPCVTLGTFVPAGRHMPEGGISMQRATDIGPALELFGASTGPVPALSRRSALAGMRASRAMSAARLAANPTQLRSAAEGYDSAIGVLGGPVASLDYAAIAAAYGVTGTVVSDVTRQMMAAEVMIRLGSKVVITMNGGWDTHGDINGTVVRNKMNATVMPGLSKFLERMLSPSCEYEVTVVITGDFARSLPGSDHASCMVATVLGPRVKTGTTGRVDAQVGMNANTPGFSSLWSYLAETARVTTNPFGDNPHRALLLP